MIEYAVKLYRRLFGERNTEIANELNAQESEVLSVQKASKPKEQLKYEKLTSIERDLFNRILRKKIIYERERVTYTNARPSWVSAKPLTDRVELMKGYGDEEIGAAHEIMTLDGQLINRIYKSVHHEIENEPKEEEKPEFQKSKKYFVGHSEEEDKESYNPEKYFKKAEKQAKERNPGLSTIDIIKRIGVHFMTYYTIRRGEYTPSEELAKKIYITFGNLGVIIDESFFERTKMNTEDIWDKCHLVSVSGLKGDEKLSSYSAYSEDSPERKLLLEDRKTEIKKALMTLNSREREVLTMYFGLNGEKEMYLEEIGKQLRLTKERIRQIKENAIKKLNRPKRRRNLEYYL